MTTHDSAPAVDAEREALAIILWGSRNIDRWAEQDETLAAALDAVGDAP